MGPTYQTNADLYANLRELAQGSFPRRCNTCGRNFKTADELLRATSSIASDHSGLKQGIDDDGTVIIELFRNCSCGSTLMDFFHSRRDVTAAGAQRRHLFDSTVRKLVANGVEEVRARTEILGWLRGQGSNLKNMIEFGK